MVLIRNIGEGGLGHLKIVNRKELYLAVVETK
jgi:hypothetical protein